MSKFLRCYRIFRKMILEVTKQTVIMIAKRNVLVMDVKIVAFELSDPFAKVGAQQADNGNSSSPPEVFHTSVFLAESFG